MALVRLDNGDYINTEHIAQICVGKGIVYEKGEIILGMLDGSSKFVTPVDRDRIVEAMKPKQRRPKTPDPRFGIKDDYLFITATGADILRMAIDDWEDIAPDQPFPDWFKESGWIEGKTKYTCDSNLMNIEEDDNEQK